MSTGRQAALTFPVVALPYLTGATVPGTKENQQQLITLPLARFQGWGRHGSSLFRVSWLSARAKTAASNKRRNDSDSLWASGAPLQRPWPQFCLAGAQQTGAKRFGRVGLLLGYCLCLVPCDDIIQAPTKHATTTM